MASEISISNMALGHIGHSKIIQSFTEGSNAANQCKLFFDIARDALLSEHSWLFAKQQVALALSGTAPTGWDYQYSIPVNCLKPLRIYNPDSDKDEDRIPFERRINAGGTAGVIVTDKAEAELIYTQRIETVSLMPAYFIVPLSFRLAEFIAGPITKNDKEVLAKVRSDFAIAKAEAMASDAQAFYKAPKSEASWTTARNI